MAMENSHESFGKSLLENFPMTIPARRSYRVPTNLLLLTP